MAEAIKTENAKGRCVYIAPIARAMLKKGHTVIDIKPNREIPNATVFVFKDVENFNEDFEATINELKEKKEQKRLNELQRKEFPQKVNTAFNAADDAE